ncbi:MAG: hypothetical protein EA393_00845 [Bacteroidetes bacterium]|nr:MAG: hypothetical protein EA393_00845 [Bacteroidota bacterium]
MKSVVYTGDCENRAGFAAQYLWVGKSVFSPGRNFSPTRTGGGMNACEGMTLGHGLTKIKFYSSFFLIKKKQKIKASDDSRQCSHYFPFFLIKKGEKIKAS